MKISRKKIKISIDVYAIRCFVFFLILIEPKLFVKFTLINLMYAAGACVCLFLLIAEYVKKKRKITKALFLLVAMRLSFALQTLFNQGDFLMWGYFSIVLIALYIMFELWFEKRPITFLRMLQNVLLLFTIINFGLMLVYPKGMIDGNFFLGIRTRLTDWLFPLVMLSMTLDSLCDRKISIKTLLAISITIATIIHQWIATALVGLAVMFIAYFLLMRVDKCNKINFNLITYGSLGISVAVVVFQIQHYFSWLIEGILGKQMNLTLRTSIWENAISKIAKSPVWGYGLPDDGLHVAWLAHRFSKTPLWQTHNHWLQILCDGGLILFFLTIAFMLNCGRNVRKIQDQKAEKVILACYSAFMLMAVAELYSYTLGLYFILYIAAFLQRCIRRKNI